MSGIYDWRFPLIVLCGVSFGVTSISPELPSAILLKLSHLTVDRLEYRKKEEPSRWGIIWKVLKPLKALRILNIYYNVIKSLGSEFSQYAPKDMEQLGFYGTETKSLLPGVFSHFTKLDKIEVSGTKLTTLKRDLFPVPFNVRYLYFNINKISSITNDLFTQMPNLKAVGLRMNQITTLPESAFDGNFVGIQYLWLDDNPLRCDCLMQWITRKKPADLKGKCVSPDKMQGKELKDLSPGDFNC